MSVTITPYMERPWLKLGTVGSGVYMLNGGILQHQGQCQQSRWLPTYRIDSDDPDNWIIFRVAVKNANLFYVSVTSRQWQYRGGRLVYRFERTSQGWQSSLVRSSGKLLLLLDDCIVEWYPGEQDITIYDLNGMEIATNHYERLVNDVYAGEFDFVVIVLQPAMGTYHYEITTVPAFSVIHSWDAPAPYVPQTVFGNFVLHGGWGTQISFYDLNTLSEKSLPAPASDCNIAGTANKLFFMFLRHGGNGVFYSYTSGDDGLTDLGFPVYASSGTDPLGWINRQMGRNLYLMPDENVFLFDHIFTRDTALASGWRYRPGLRMPRDAEGMVPPPYHFFADNPSFLVIGSRSGSSNEMFPTWPLYICEGIETIQDGITEE